MERTPPRAVDHSEESLLPCIAALPRASGSRLPFKQVPEVWSLKNLCHLRARLPRKGIQDWLEAPPRGEPRREESSGRQRAVDRSAAPVAARATPSMIDRRPRRELALARLFLPSRRQSLSQREPARERLDREPYSVEAPAPSERGDRGEGDDQQAS